MSEIITRQDSYLNEKYYYIKHDSGLDMYVFPKEMSTSFALFGTRYGSNNNIFKAEGDSDYTTVPNGIAHFLEHKMFENEDGIDTFERFSKIGASANAFTSHSMTAYLFSCTENFRESLEILLDFVTKPYFTPETVRKEQGIIGQEIEMYKDNPKNELYYGLMSGLYKNNPTKIEIAGSVKSISKITDKILYKCYNTFYSLSNMLLSVSGNVTPEEVIAVADKILKKQNTKKIEKVYPEEPDGVVKSRVVKAMRVAKPLFAIGIKDNEINISGFERIKKQAAFTILNEMLFGASSAFFAELYEKNLISGTLSDEYEITESYAFDYFGGESSQPEAVYSAFCDTVKKTIENHLDEESFKVNKNIALADFVKDFDSTEDIAFNLLSAEFNDADIFDYPKAIKEIDMEYLEKLLKDKFNEKNISMSVINPIE